MTPIPDENAIEITAETQKEKKKEKKKDEEQPDAMSEEDQELKERLETCVSTVLNSLDEASVTMEIRLNALDVIVNELRSATSSMTSVPKPLKFLRPFFDDLKGLHGGNLEELYFRARLADVLAVLAMTMGKQGMYLDFNDSII